MTWDPSASAEICVRFNRMDGRFRAFVGDARVWAQPDIVPASGRFLEFTVCTDVIGEDSNGSV